MGIFGGKRARAAASPVALWPGFTGNWRPDPADEGQPTPMPGSAMNDDGCASDIAWCASFTCADQLASLTVCCYPSYAGPGADADGYIIGYRVEYEWGSCAQPSEPWKREFYTSESLRNGGVAFDVRYMDLDRAVESARIQASWLMEGAAAILPPPECLWEYFGWDGAPW